MIFKNLVTQLSSLVISLFLAVFVWAVATNEENPTREAIFSDPIPIQYTNLAPRLSLYQKSGESVRVRLRAPQATWQNLRVDSFQAVADLRALDSGVLQVPVAVKSIDPQVTVVAVDPPGVSVQLENIKQVPVEVRVRILDDAPLGYEFKTPIATPISVTVMGPQVLVDQVNDATADVALRGAKTPIDREVVVGVHDAGGNPIQGVTVKPSTVMVHIEVDQRVGYKDVAVKATLKGAVSSGYWISDISVDPPTVTLVGAPQALDKIPGFVQTQPVTVTASRADIVKPVGLSLPTDVSALNVTEVNVHVAVEPVLGGITILRPVAVSLSNVGCDLPTTISPDTVEVILSGPLPNLQALTGDDVQIVVDVSGCTPGSFQATPRVVNVPTLLKVESIVPNTVEVTIKPH
jgi:YbbR domain-containing protein